MWFLPELWADGRRSFPSTQLAFSIWVPGPLLTPYSQNTFSSHRNPSNSQHIRAAQLMASLSAQPPRISARETGITGHGKPICPTARMFCSRNGHHRPRQAYLPNRPGYLLAKRSLQVTTTWISVREMEAKGHDHPDGLLILLKIPLNCLFHSFCIQRICLCLISCNQLNCGDDSICNIILLLGHGTSDIGAVIY